ncbi:uncharacterized protein LOC114309168 [Camellia sinensis]|uniref:uncharacterized protein LOC114309168 n=1 Tax=Camellia sinensis TaxID=4442 RepID=UPI0010368CC6|nr:uncharacterized protein LOC114309168 [Camellia sinensis]
MGNTSIHTLFVDNLPESMDPKGLYNMFTKFGVVKDVFISLKRRKTIRSRFGFVCYNCHIAANMAIQKANAVWCDNTSLVVKSAAFKRDQKGEVQNISNQNIQGKKNDAGSVNRRPSFARW